MGIMAQMILALLSVVCFCFCCHFFIKEVLRSLPRLNQTGYTRAALRIEKGYRVFAFGLMSIAFLFGLVVSFYQVYVLL